MWPLGTTPSQEILEDTVLDCVGSRGDKPCLFNIQEDESEYVNIAALYPDVVKGMQLRMDQLRETFLDPPDLFADSCPENFRMVVEVGVQGAASQKELPCGCWMAVYNYNGFDGPYQDLPDDRFYFSMETLPDMATGKEVSASAAEEGGAAEGAVPPPDFADDYDHPQVADEYDHPQVDGSKSEDYDSPKVDRSEEFDHPKIDHSTDPTAGSSTVGYGSGQSVREKESHHAVEEVQEFDTMKARRREFEGGAAAAVTVGHDLYLMAGIALFITIGLTTKYCIRGKMEKQEARIRAYDAVLP